ncbi:MAG: sigma-70 family RNA polymerase sigma factor [Eubacteriales bacterium]|nr:sigma-70 family RNA polymerase sigma factor [Eubacteriales bacterium]
MSDTMGAIVDKYSGMVYRTAFSYLSSREDAEDVMQEVFIRFFKQHKIFNDEEHEKAWFLRVTINCSKNALALRKRKRETETAAAEQLITDRAKEDYSFLFREVMSLPSKQRICVHLFYYENYSVGETARITGFLPSTVKSHLRRARNTLKSKLKGVYSDEHLEEL